MPTPTAHQLRAVAELREIAAHGGPGIVRVGALDSLGRLPVDVNVNCRDVAAMPQAGIALRREERLRVFVPAEFPFAVPTVETPHRRWAGTPHVQFGSHICLYRSPSIEWNPADGMFGFMDRLLAWLVRASVGQLDATGEPMHPPVAYDWFGGGGVLIARANAPRLEPGSAPWLGAALVRRVSAERVDIVGWVRLGDGDWLDAVGAVGGTDTFLAAAVVLGQPIGFEMPYTAAFLASHLADQGVARNLTIGLIGLASALNRRLLDLRGEVDGVPLFTLVGTPSRGITGTEPITHLSAWRLPDEIAPLLAAVPARLQRDGQDAANVGDTVLSNAHDWLRNARVHWVTVYEMRPETTVRRDVDSTSRWLRGKSVLILGAGALGAPIADACVRGGAAAVAVIDNGIVHPGILVRQPYFDDEIGKNKAVVLASRLTRISPGTPVTAFAANAVTKFFPPGCVPPDADLVIDATADTVVRHVVEARRRSSNTVWPPIITAMIGHDAQRGIATVSTSTASGASVDVLRRLGSAARADATGRLADVVEDFYPESARTDLFQPEPGCSSPTFRGSAADVAGLAGQLLVGALAALEMPETPGAPTMHAIVVRMPNLDTAPSASPGSQHLSWESDHLITDLTQRYEIRLSTNAVAEIRAEVRRGARLRGPTIETGGILLGEFDDASGVIWVDTATGPPPDSRLSASHFARGTEGVAELISAQMTQTSRSSGYVGEWHSHPRGAARPSKTDDEGMADVLSCTTPEPRRALLLIVGGPADVWQDFLAVGEPPHWYAGVIERDHSTPSRVTSNPRRVILEGSSWPGGWRTVTPTGSRRRRRFSIVRRRGRERRGAESR